MAQLEADTQLAARGFFAEDPNGETFPGPGAQFDQPIGNYQLIQLKLAKMEVARLNLENLVFRYIETRAAGEDLTWAEASAMKLYAAQAAMEVTT